MAAVWYRKTMPPIELAERLALLLALAFFLGLAFEEIYKRDEPTIPGGIRTFPLVGLAGAMLYLVEPQRTVAFVAGLLALGAWLYAFIRLEQSREGGSGGTLVIPVSNLLVYVLGPIVLLQPPWVAVGVTVAAVLVIGARERMHGFVRLIPQDEVLTAGKFLILVGVILPLVPDTRLIATAAVTPYHIWLAVVAISGLSYLTYLIQRYLPIKGGALLPALLGGAYSSTETTVVLAKRQREAATRRPELSAGIVAVTAIMYPRLAAVVAFFNLPLAVALLPLSLPLHRRSGGGVAGVAEDRARRRRGSGGSCRQPVAADNRADLRRAVYGGVPGDRLGRGGVRADRRLHARSTRRSERHRPVCAEPRPRRCAEHALIRGRRGGIDRRLRQ